LLPVRYAALHNMSMVYVAMHMRQPFQMAQVLESPPPVFSAAKSGKNALATASKFET
jgi:hypothetical protein